MGNEQQKKINFFSGKRKVLLRAVVIGGLTVLFTFFIWVWGMESIAFAELILFFGRFHILLVHLPVGLLLLALILEFVSGFGRFSHLKEAVGFVLILGAASAVSTVVAGLMLATGGGYDTDILNRHKWWGTGVAVIAVLACLFKYLPKKLELTFSARTETAGYRLSSAPAFLGKFRFRHAYRISLAGAVIVLMIASHYGGTLTHGPGYLTYYMPDTFKPVFGLSVEDELPVIENIEEAVIFTNLVFPIIESRCISCHKPDRAEGDLRMDSYEQIMRGGESGPVLVAGDPESSDLHHRIILPRDHDDRMPPGTRRSLTDEQIRIIRWWIEEEASPDRRVAEAQLSPEIEDILALYSGERVVRQFGVPPHDIDPADPAALEGLSDSMMSVSRLSEDQPYMQGRFSGSPDEFHSDLLQDLMAVSGQLVWLNLSNTPADDRVLEYVGGLENLTRLHLNGTEITDDGLEHLTRLEFLEYLNIHNTRVTDAGLERLAGLPNLARLYLWQTEVTEEGIARLLDRNPDLEVNAGFEFTGSQESEQ